MPSAVPPDDITGGQTNIKSGVRSVRQRGQNLWRSRTSPSTDMAALHLGIVSCVFVLAIAVAVAVAVFA